MVSGSTPEQLGMSPLKYEVTVCHIHLTYAVYFHLKRKSFETELK
jgi:hypothetical protein